MLVGALLAAIAFGPAALSNAAPAKAQAPAGCSFAGDDFSLAIKTADIVAVGAIQPDAGDGIVRFVPETFLKGPARTDPLLLQLVASSPAVGCRRANVTPGERVLAILGSGSGDFAGQWPEARFVYHLRDGTAVPDAGGKTVSEENLVVVIRDLTGQFAVPAATNESGASIDWRGTVLPVGATLIAVFIISLFLMKYWHKIDPT